MPRPKKTVKKPIKLKPKVKPKGFYPKGFNSTKETIFVKPKDKDFENKVSPMITRFGPLDAWQEEVLKMEGNICLCSGRQVGKSQIIAIKTAEFINDHPDKTVLIISITEDQAERMLQKILLYLHDNHKDQMVLKGVKKPTKHKVHMKNGSVVVTKAVGQYGLGVLGMTVDIVVPDECAFLPEAIWASITPMLLTTGGKMWLLSTPNAMQGYFYEAYTNPEMGFKTIHVSSEEVGDARPEPQRSIMLEYLKREKGRMTELQYAQQYLAQFLEELGQFFPDDLIHATQTEDRVQCSSNPDSSYYLGVDVARMGGDETTFEILEKVKDDWYHRENITHTYTLTTETIDKIIALDTIYDFKRIYIDDGGLGAPVLDQLLISDQVKRKVEGINNASRALDRDSNRRKKLMKEDLYLNLKILMERGRIHLLKDADVGLSLKSIIVEKNPKSNDIRIYGKYSHIVEGLIRAAWAERDKRLKLYFEVQ